MDKTDRADQLTGRDLMQKLLDREELKREDYLIMAELLGLEVKEPEPIVTPGP